MVGEKAVTRSVAASWNVVCATYPELCPIADKTNVLFKSISAGANPVNVKPP
jgi:hypothetical protein